jgi:hypothetical protein
MDGVSFFMWASMEARGSASNGAFRRFDVRLADAVAALADDQHAAGSML